MLFTQVTRCPHCHTSFRVSDEHLEAAGGIVRCGSCLQVFKATEHLVNESEPANTAPHPPEEPSTPIAAVDSESEATSVKPSSFAFTFADDIEQEAETETELDTVSTEDAPAQKNVTFDIANFDDTPDTDNIDLTALEEPAEALAEAPKEAPAEATKEATAEAPVEIPSENIPEQKLPELDHFSAHKAAQHKAALASHLVDLSADDDEDLDLDLEGEMLISDEGIVPIDGTDTLKETTIEEIDVSNTSLPNEPSPGPEDNSDTHVVADDLALKQPTESDDQNEGTSHDETNHVAESHLLSELPVSEVDVNTELEHSEEADLISAPTATDEELKTKETRDYLDNFEFTQTSKTEHVPTVSDTPTPDVTDATSSTQETTAEPLENIDFSLEETIDTPPNSLTAAVSSDHDEDDFAGLLDDAMAEAETDDNASLDDLLDGAESEKERPADTPRDIEDDLLFHDDMEGADRLAELLGEDEPVTNIEDPLTANLANMVSDDYNDIMSTNEDDDDYEDTAYEDKWALELLGSDAQKKPKKFTDDISGPDLDSIEEFESSGGISFSDIHEQNRSSNTFDDDLSDFNTDLDEAGGDNTDSYVDDYVDDTLDDLQDIPPASNNLDEEVAYDERLPGGHDENYTNEFDTTPEGQAIADDIGLPRELEISIPNMTMEPIELTEEKPNTHGLLWSFIAIVLIVIAIAQVGWFRFDSAARSETWRPVYEQICGVVGCKLPGLQNVQFIRASNTVFNQHRSNPNGLVVDTLLTNTANYPQPFPDIELEFRDLNGQIVAQRTFAPSDYLAGDVLPGDSMPSDIPVHIALEVVNPGPEAVSRQIFIRANQ